MTALILRRAYAVSVALIIASSAGATSVPSQTFEELTDHSEMVVSGQILRSWSDWDSEHAFIWTHYELSVSTALKGGPGASVVLSEPGGAVGLQGMNIAGVVTYQPGERVLVFLQRMPNGYLRTTGWSQGKYTVDDSSRIHAAGSSRSLEFVSASASAVLPKPAATPLSSIDGIGIAGLRARIAARLNQQGRAQ